MTPIQDAIADIRQRVDELNKKAQEYEAEGLPFSFVTDPAEPGVGLLEPLARVSVI